MSEAIAAFFGAVVGSLLPLFFARRLARDQMHGQRWAEHRMEVIESLMLLVSATCDASDRVDRIPIPGTVRPIEAIYQDFSSSLTRAKLYLSEDVITALRPFGQWLFDEHVSGGHAQNPSPPHDAVKRVYDLLAEAAEGKHRRF